MALGQIVLINSLQSKQVTIPSGNYPWPTIRVVNPNDGVLYVKQNAAIVDSGYGSWDYKVPSQSFGILPSEGQGWQSVGLYYVDQSGANRPGEVTIYLSQTQQIDPAFVAIGRSLVAQTSSVDIASGSQPSNPGAGFGRLWIDTSGHLNVLQPSGSNYVVLDSNNVGTYVTPLINAATLGGDLYGTVANGHVGIQNNSFLGMRDSGGVLRSAIWYTTGSTPGGETRYNAIDTGAFSWVNQANSAYAMSLTQSGNLNVIGTITESAGVIYFVDTAHSITMSGGNMLLFCGSGNQFYFWQTGAPTWATVNTGVINANGAIHGQYVYASDGGNGIFYAGAGDMYFRFAGGSGNYRFDQGGAMFVHGPISTDTNGAAFVMAGGGSASTGPLIQWNSTGMWLGTYSNGLLLNGTQLFFQNNGAYYIQSSGGTFTLANSSLAVPGSIGVQGAGPGTSGYAIYIPNAAAAYGQGFANAWINASSVKFKKNIRNLRDPLAIILNSKLNGVEYDHDWELPKGSTKRNAGRTHSLGFVADYWLPFVPEVVSVDEFGDAQGMDYSRVSAITFQALKEYVIATNKRLDALEAKV